MDSQDAADNCIMRDLLQQTKDSHLRSKQNEGKKVALYPTRAEIMASFTPLFARMKAKRSAAYTASTTHLPPHYLPCVRPSDELKPIFVSDMTLETHHRGRKVLLRLCAEACRLTALLVVAEDEHETPILVQMYHQPEENVIPSQQLLKKGMVLLLKEPYFKQTADGAYVLRVDHVSDLIWLHGDDERIPFAWMPRIFELDSSESRLEGNSHFNKNEWGSALEQYTHAIKCSETLLDAQISYINCSLVNLRLGRPTAAFNDAVATNSKLQPTEKGLFREAVCLYHLQRFDECLSKFQKLRVSYPNNKEVQVEIAKTIARLRECNDGIYNWEDMQHQAKKGDRLIDCGTFSKNVEIRQSPGKGRGLFTTKSVVAGDLLICEKAFSYSFLDTDNGTKEHQNILLLSAQPMQALLGGQVQNLTRIIQKLYHEPETAASFLEMNHGNYVPLEHGLLVDSKPVVDTFLVAKVIALNSASAPTTLGYMKDGLRGHQKELGEELMLEPNGIWCMASYINHSCVANCCRAFIGDMMIIRATEDMPAGTELKVLYRPLSPAETYDSTQQKLANWGFSCDCYLCEMKKATTKTDMRQRQANLQSLGELVARPGHLNMTQARLLLKQIDKTYKKSGQKALKLGLQSGYFGYGTALFRRGSIVEAASALIRVLELGGFILAARAANDHQSAAVVDIQKWGPYSHHALFAIINLYLICRGTAMNTFLPNHPTRMIMYAETAYALLVGEKETFDSTLEL
ncbi:hypothetical protein LLEC1_07556 [Akanthomyces lecanii]|uniref:SET domain-containing protein n=1 Tax=Cordyceps confragosa TaxID=2714763 RepID=A0A179IK90_CORDF|nr:hypothetical protein LLEC1_07556 [Akanthomyces lecanii]